MRADPFILQLKYADVVSLLAEKAAISYDEALEMFYESRTYRFMSEGVSDMHCMSDLYLVEEILSEQDGSLGRNRTSALA